MEATGAVKASDGGWSRDRAVLAAALLLLGLLFVLDVVNVADRPLPILYGLPVLLVAQRHAPPITATVGGLALLLFAVGVILVWTPGVLPERMLLLATMVLLSVLLARRVQEARAARAAAEQARDEAQAAHRRLERFMGVVAHDLRGPLAAMDGWAQMATRRGASEEQRDRALATVREQTQRMARLVQDLLDAARIGVGQLDVRAERMDLTALVRQVIEEQQATAPEHAIGFHAEGAVEGDWDPDRLRQVFGNLVGNALKYSPDGTPIAVRVACAEGQATVTVTDRGLGLRPEDVERLFQPFGRGTEAADLPGTGLGLYISRAIIEAHGGSIRVDSPGPGQGATFRVSLPLQSNPVSQRE